MTNDLIKKIVNGIENEQAAFNLEYLTPKRCAQIATDIIRAEIAEPNAAMELVVSKNWGRRTWAEYRQVIAASPLGEKEG